MAVSVNLVYPTDGLTNVAITTNYTISITGQTQTVQLWLGGELEQEWEVLQWTGTKYLNPTADLINNTEYSWYVKVKDWNTPFDWAQSPETWSFTTIGSAPTKAKTPAPANTVTDVTLDQATLTWEDGGNTDTFDVYYGTTSGSLTKVSDTQAGTSFTVTGITNGSPYDYLITRYWRIDSTNDAGTTTGDEWLFTTIRLSPPAPTYFYSTTGQYYQLRMQSDGSYGSQPADGGVENTDFVYLAAGYEANFIKTTRKLVGIANSKVWIEDL